MPENVFLPKVNSITQDNVFVWAFSFFFFFSSAGAIIWTSGLVGVWRVWYSITCGDYSGFWHLSHFFMVLPESLASSGYDVVKLSWWSFVCIVLCKALQPKYSDKIACLDGFNTIWSICLCMSVWLTLLRYSYQFKFWRMFTTTSVYVCRVDSPHPSAAISFQHWWVLLT